MSKIIIRSSIFYRNDNSEDFVVLVLRMCVLMDRVTGVDGTFKGRSQTQNVLLYLVVSKSLCHPRLHNDPK